MDLNSAFVFVRVARAGSFSQAAKNMGMPISTVSTKVAALEQQLGASLLRRTTRRLHLTPAGERFLVHAERAVAEFQEAETCTTVDHAEPRGFLRVTGPVEMGTTVVSDLVAKFLRAYPEIQVELLLTDRVVDLVAENVDLAIRIGELEDSSLISRKIGSTRLELFASPAYLRARSAPVKPQDLAEHECLRFTMSDDRKWVLKRGAKAMRVEIAGRFGANNLASVHKLAVHGQGIALLPPFFCTADLKDGTLVSVLKGWVSPAIPVWVVYPSQRYLPPRHRVFVDYLMKNLEAVF